MDIADAQREVRTEFLGGFFGQLVSGGVWLLSATLGTWRSPATAIWAAFAGGLLIFPLTLICLRMTGRRASLSASNPMGQLATQLVFTLNFPLVAAATLHRLDWFYPACLLAVGAHYIPFVFLYGMRMFAVLGAIFMAVGLVIGMYLPGTFTLGGWIGAAVLVTFAFIGRALVERKSRPGVSWHL